MAANSKGLLRVLEANQMAPSRDHMEKMKTKKDVERIDLGADRRGDEFVEYARGCRDRAIACFWWCCPKRRVNLKLKGEDEAPPDVLRARAQLEEAQKDNARALKVLED